jgi:carboxylesterase
MLALILIAFVAAAALAAVRALMFARAAREVDTSREHDPAGIIVGAGGYTAGPADSPAAVLLLHGFGDTPQSMRELGESLGGAGYRVEAPLLAGHGRTVRAFARSRARDWKSDAAAALDRLTGAHASVVIVGQSMGGAMAVLLASSSEARMPALVLLSPYLAPSRTVERIARWPILTGMLAPIIGSRAGTASIHDPAARAKSLGYGVTTARLLSELVGLAETARQALPRVAAPTLWIQSRQDNRISPAAAQAAFEQLGAADRRMDWLEHSGHVITADAERELVIAKVLAWLSQHVRMG